MPVTNRTGSGALPELPHWETAPADRPAAIAQVKEALRTRIQGSGRSISEVFSVIEARVRAQVDEIAAANAEDREVWPVINYSDIAAGTVSTDDVALLHRRGCVVVRGHFPRQQALDWDQGIVDYVEQNRFFEDYRGPGDDFFGSVGSKPEIYPIYWSQAQMEARQSEQMARVQQFLNEQWISESDGTGWFDPTHDAIYPDRIRRRPPGANSSGLGAHLDSGTLDLWMTADVATGVPPRLRRDRSSSTTHGMQRIALTGTQYRGTHDVRCVPHLPGLDRAVATWTTIRACCTRCRSPTRWRTCCCAHCSPMCPTTTCAAWPSTRSSHHRTMALAATRRVQRDPRRPRRRHRVVAQRHDPQRRSRGRPTRLGQRHVHPRRALVPTQRHVRRVGPRRLPHWVEPHRLPRGALRAHLDRPVHDRRPQRHRSPRTRPASPQFEGLNHLADQSGSRPVNAISRASSSASSATERSAS